jgi:hypothetical protein
MIDLNLEQLIARGQELYEQNENLQSPGTLFSRYDSKVRNATQVTGRW